MHLVSLSSYLPCQKKSATFRASIGQQSRENEDEKKKRKKRTRDTDVKNHEIHAHSTVVALKTKVSRLRHIQSQIET